MSIASIIPYQLRPKKAIERNLFISILKKLDRYSKIDISKYRYVGFGAAFLEDFKMMHVEFGISTMDSIESEPHAYLRQLFNNPYYFVNIFNYTSSEYITSTDFKSNKNQIIWWDYTSPKDFRQQLMDIDITAQKISHLDILKFTFNVHRGSFWRTHNIDPGTYDDKKLLKFLKEDETYQYYLPPKLAVRHIIDNFSAVLRAMSIIAIKRGLSKAGSSLIFNHIASFNYADAAEMSTLTGIFSEANETKDILKQSSLNEDWEFYQEGPLSEYIEGNFIDVPVMTLSERIKIDKLIPVKKRSNIASLAKKLKFSYGINEIDNLRYLEAYCRYYKYLPHYFKVTY